MGTRKALARRLPARNPGRKSPVKRTRRDGSARGSHTALSHTHTQRRRAQREELSLHASNILALGDGHSSLSELPVL